MGKVIGIVAIKGGVGKTTIAASLATDLANNCNKKILLIDANYSAPNLGLHMDILLPEKTIHDVLEGKIKLKNAINNRYGVDVIAGSYILDGRLHASLGAWDVEDVRVGTSQIVWNGADEATTVLDQETAFGDVKKSIEALCAVVLGETVVSGSEVDFKDPDGNIVVNIQYGSEKGQRVTVTIN